MYSYLSFIDANGLEALKLRVLDLIKYYGRDKVHLLFVVRDTRAAIEEYFALRK